LLELCESSFVTLLAVVNVYRLSLSFSFWKELITQTLILSTLNLLAITSKFCTVTMFVMVSL